MTTTVFLENIYKFYNNVPVVNDLSFKIEVGEIFALLGPNGAGKSTTIRMLTTLTKPSQGRIKVGGCDESGYAGKIEYWRNLVANQRG